MFPWKLLWERKAERQGSINLAFCSPSETTFQVRVIKNSWHCVTCYSPVGTEQDRGGCSWRAVPHVRAVADGAGAALGGINKLYPPPPTSGTSFCARSISTPYQALDGSSKRAVKLLHSFRRKRQPGVLRSTSETWQVGRVGDRHTQVLEQFWRLPLWSLFSTSEKYAEFQGEDWNSIEKVHWIFWQFTDAE